MKLRNVGTSGAAPRVVAGAVAGDDPGDAEKELLGHVRDVGFEVVDLGADVSAARFAGAVREHRPLAVVLSCQLVVCAGGVGRVIEELERQRLRDAARVLLAGAGFTRDFAREIGADAFVADPAAAAVILRGWLDS